MRRFKCFFSSHKNSIIHRAIIEIRPCIKNSLTYKRLKTKNVLRAATILVSIISGIK